MAEERVVHFYEPTDANIQWQTVVMPPVQAADAATEVLQRSYPNYNDLVAAGTLPSYDDLLWPAVHANLMAIGLHHGLPSSYPENEQQRLKYIREMTLKGFDPDWRIGYMVMLALMDARSIATCKLDLSEQAIVASGAEQRFAQLAEAVQNIFIDRTWNPQDETTAELASKNPYGVKLLDSAKQMMQLSRSRPVKRHVEAPLAPVPDTYVPKTHRVEDDADISDAFRPQPSSRVGILWNTTGGKEDVERGLRAKFFVRGRVAAVRDLIAEIRSVAQTTITRLEEELADERQRMADMAKQMTDRARGARADELREIIRLRQRVDTLEEERDVAIRNFNEQRNLNAAAQQNVANLELDMQKGREYVTFLAGEVAKCNDKGNTMTGEKAKLQEEYERLTRELADCKLAWNKLVADNAKLQEEYDDIVAQIPRLGTQQSNCYMELSQCKSALRTTHDQLDAAQQEIQRSADGLKDCEASRSQLSSRAGDMERLVQECYVEGTRIQTEYDQLVAKHNELVEYSVQLKREVARLQQQPDHTDDLGRCITELQECEKRVKQNGSEARRLGLEVERLRGEHDRAVADVIAERDQLEKAYENLRKLNDAQDVIIIDAAKNMRALTDDRDAAVAQQHNLQLQLNAVSAKWTHCVAEIAQKDDALAKHQQPDPNIERLGKEIADLQVQLARSQKAVDITLLKASMAAMPTDAGTELAMRRMKEELRLAKEVAAEGTQELIHSRKILEKFRFEKKQVEGELKACRDSFARQQPAASGGVQCHEPSNALLAASSAQTVEMVHSLLSFIGRIRGLYSGLGLFSLSLERVFQAMGDGSIDTQGASRAIASFMLYAKYARYVIGSVEYEPLFHAAETLTKFPWTTCDELRACLHSTVQLPAVNERLRSATALRNATILLRDWEKTGQDEFAALRAVTDSIVLPDGQRLTSVPAVSKFLIDEMSWLLGRDPPVLGPIEGIAEDW